MGGRQELGLALLCLLLALVALVRGWGSVPAQKASVACPKPGMVATDLGPRLACGRGGPLDAHSRLLMGQGLDLNQATSRDLQVLPGIGPQRAAQILKRRRELGRFSHLNQLLEIRGIGEKTLAKLKPWLQLSGSR